jgi:putative ABC transport system substrate-binding protein
LAPTAALIAILVNPDEPAAESQVEQAQAAAQAIGQQFLVLRASTERDIDGAFAAIVERRAGALLLGANPFFAVWKNQLFALASSHAVPTLYWRSELARAGGLMSYGSNAIETYRHLGDYAARILKGEKPANLPILQPTRFELVINLKTAKALGLMIPPSVLALADEVIE